MDECRSVVITCSQSLSLPYGEVVYRGFSNGFCTVLFARPPRCLMSPGTEVRYGVECRYEEEELVNNVAVREMCRGYSKENIYVYPKKIYREIEKLYIEPLASSGSPFANGLIMVGAPGTGKSVMARIIARKIGVEPIYISMDNVLSKYVGEGEKRLRQILRSARESAPSVVIIDDADVLFSPRSLASQSEVQYIANLQQIMFDEIQSISDRREPVLIIATTNKKASEIDQAFLRFGRFGDPIYFPLPDEEAVYVVVKQFISDDSEARRLARKLVNAGLSMADVIFYVKKKVELGVEEIPPRGGRGYSRIAVDYVRDIETVFERSPYLKKIFSGSSWKIYIPSSIDVGVAVCAQISYYLRKPPVWITDERYFDEAVHMGNMINAVIIAQTSLSPFAQNYIALNSKVPVFLVGTEPPAPSIAYHTLPLRHMMTTPYGKKALIKAVAKFKGVEIPQDLEKKLESISLSETAVEKLLNFIASTGYIDEAIVSDIMRYA